MRPLRLLGRHATSRRLVLSASASAIALAAGAWCAAASAIPTTGHAVPPTLARTDTERVTDKADAWYASSPLDDICLGGGLPCISVPLPTPTYPAGTLHVGVTLGKETARSYLVLGLNQPVASLAGATGTLVLPVAQGVTDRTVEPANASILVCLAASRVKAVVGATTSPPAVDCSASVHARYDAKLARFTVNLDPFLRDWAQGAPDNGLALLPDTSSATLTTVWQVSLSGRAVANGPKIAGLVRLRRSQLSATPAPTPTDTGTPSPAPPTVTLPVAPPLPGVATAPVATAPAPEIAGSVPSPAADARPTRRAYLNSSVFLVPLALLACGVFFGRLFTADPFTGRRKRS